MESEPFLKKVTSRKKEVIAGPHEHEITFHFSDGSKAWFCVEEGVTKEHIVKKYFEQ